LCFVLSANLSDKVNIMKTENNHNMNIENKNKRILILIVSVFILIAIITAGLLTVLRPSPSLLESETSSSDAASLTTSSEKSNSSEVENSKPEPAESSQTPDTVSDTPSETSTPETSTPDGKVNEPSEPVDASYYDDACFIGNSRTEGFMAYAGPSGASYYVYKGLTVSGIFNTNFIKDGDKKLTVADALKNKQFGKIYIMLGINELGWAYSNVFYERYCKAIDHVKAVQPNAKIFVQSIFPVSAKKSESDQYINNKRINEYNELIKIMCAEKNVVYLDVGAALRDENGNLPEEAAYDGVHLKKPYCEKWRYFLDTHTHVTAEAEVTGE
jgi:hypothetical protein